MQTSPSLNTALRCAGHVVTGIFQVIGLLASISVGAAILGFAGHFTALLFGVVHYGPAFFAGYVVIAFGTFIGVVNCRIERS